MTLTNFSRRALLAGAVAALAALPLASALAAPFASDRITVRTEGAGPDVILIPGLNSSPRAWDSTVAALAGLPLPPGAHCRIRRAAGRRQQGGNGGGAGRRRNRALHQGVEPQAAGRHRPFDGRHHRHDAGEPPSGRTLAPDGGRHVPLPRHLLRRSRRRRRPRSKRSPTRSLRACAQPRRKHVRNAPTRPSPAWSATRRCAPARSRTR